MLNLMLGLFFHGLASSSSGCFMAKLKSSLVRPKHTVNENWIYLGTRPPFSTNANSLFAFLYINQLVLYKLFHSNYWHIWQRVRNYGLMVHFLGSLGWFMSTLSAAIKFSEGRGNGSLNCGNGDLNCKGHLKRINEVNVIIVLVEI